MGSVTLTTEEYHALLGDSPPRGSERSKGASKRSSKPRKASAYSKRYGAAFQRIAPKNKKKNGGWKKDGFSRTQKAAHKAAKK